MGRRALLLAPLAALALAGCGSSTAAKLTPAQEQARIQFLKGHGNFDDRELAQLCPGLYPRDYLTNKSKYPDTTRRKNHKAPTVTAADRRQARAAGCDVRP
jgi:hypothetical protein